MLVKTKENEIPPVIDNKSDAGPDYFFCQACLGYHSPEYRSKKDFVHTKIENRSDSLKGRKVKQAYVVCKWSYDEMTGKHLNIDDEVPDWNKPVSDTPPASIPQARNIDEEPPEPKKQGNPTRSIFGTAKTRGRPRKNIFINIDSSKTCEELAEELGVSPMTISRRRREAQAILL